MRDINNLPQYPTITGSMFCYVDKTNLLVPDTCYSHADIKADKNNVPLYNLKTMADNQKTKDPDSIHSTVSVDMYCLEDAEDTVEVPDNIADELVLNNIAEVI
jgi:hypothetical protein